MWIATLETSYYSFLAGGTTKHKAEQALRLLWKKHVYATGADVHYLEDNWDSVCLYKVTDMSGAVDGEDPVPLMECQLNIGGKLKALPDITNRELEQEMRR